MATRYQAEYVFKGENQVKKPAEDAGRSIDKLAGKANKLTPVTQKLAASTGKLNGVMAAGQSKFAAAGGAISAFGFAAGASTGKVGQLTSGIGNLATAFVVGGPLLGGITAAGIGISALVGHFSDLEAAAKKLQEELQKSLKSSLSGIRGEVREVEFAIKMIGKSADVMEQETIKRRIRNAESQKFFMLQSLAIQAEVDSMDKERAVDLALRMKKHRTVVDKLADSLSEAAGGQSQFTKAIQAAMKPSQEFTGILATVNGLTEDSIALETLLARTVEEQRKAKEERNKQLKESNGTQINQARVYAEALDNTASMIDRMAEAEERLFKGRQGKKLFADYSTSGKLGINGIGGGQLSSQGGGSTGGTPGGFDMSALSGLAGAAGAPEALTAGLAASGGGASAAISAAAAVAGPQIAIAIAAAVATAIATAGAAPFLATGAIAGKIISDGIIANITGLPDKIFEALTQENPTQFMADFFRDTFLNLDKISENLGPVLDEVLFYLPELLERSVVAFVDVLVTTLTKAPQIITQLIAGFSRAFMVVLDNLPAIIEAAIPAMVQGLILATVAAITILFVAGPGGSLLAASIGFAFLSALSRVDWKVIGDSFGSFLGNMFGAMWNTMIAVPNQIIGNLNKLPGVSLDKIPGATISSMGSTGGFSSLGETPGDDSTGPGGGGGGVQGPVMRRTDIPTFHNGGLIRSGSNSVPIIAQGGESVLNRSATQSIGEQGVNALNSGAPMTVRFEGDGSEFFELLAEWLNRNQRNGRRLANGGAF